MKQLYPEPQIIPKKIHISVKTSADLVMNFFQLK